MIGTAGPSATAAEGAGAIICSSYQSGSALTAALERDAANKNLNCHYCRLKFLIPVFAFTNPLRKKECPVHVIEPVWCVRW